MAKGLSGTQFCMRTDLVFVLLYCQIGTLLKGLSYHPCDGKFFLKNETPCWKGLFVYEADMESYKLFPFDEMAGKHEV